MTDSECARAHLAQALTRLDDAPEEAVDNLLSAAASFEAAERHDLAGKARSAACHLLLGTDVSYETRELAQLVDTVEC